MYISLQQEIEASKSVGRTTMPLRRFIFGVVDESLRAHYGDNFSERCLQSSLAITAALNALGIKCRVIGGAVCAIEAKMVDERPVVSWGGFWDKDHHAWAQTQFHEIADLTISHLMLHPASTAAEFPVPAIWWDDVTRWPNALVYLPTGPLVTKLATDEQADTDAFMAVFRETFAVACERGIDGGYQEAILSGPESYKALMDQNHPWIVLASFVTDLPRPPWIQDKLGKARAVYERRHLAKKRAADKKQAGKARAHRKKPIKKTKKKP